MRNMWPPLRWSEITEKFKTCNPNTRHCFHILTDNEKLFQLGRIFWWVFQSNSVKTISQNLKSVTCASKFHTSWTCSFLLNRWCLKYLHVSGLSGIQIEGVIKFSWWMIERKQLQNNLASSAGLWFGWQPRQGQAAYQYNAGQKGEQWQLQNNRSFFAK